MGLSWVALAVGTFCLVAAVWQFADVASGRTEVIRRLQTVAAPEANPGLLEGVKERVGRSRLARRLGDRLLAAGIAAHPVVVLGWGAVGFTLGFPLLMSLGSPTLAVVICAFVLFGLHIWLNRRVEQRREQLVGQLPDLARLLSNAANAGLAMRTAVAMAAREIGEPARSELQHVTELMAVGYPLDEALMAMARRLPSREVSVLVTTLVVQQRSGGRVITALRNVATTLETRKEVRREIRTQVAGAISGSYIVAGLGLGSVILINTVSPGVLDTMVASSVGRMILVFSTGLYVLGFYLVRRLTRIEH